MYDYHNNLRATHPASSPWWAWPLDLKPVWFYQAGFANSTTRRHLRRRQPRHRCGSPSRPWSRPPGRRGTGAASALALIVIAFLAMWLPWARIDRATFQYHVFTSLPFVGLALAYFLAELWHGPSPGAWLLARVAAAVAILGPPLLWLVRAAALRHRGIRPPTPRNSGGHRVRSITRSTDVSQAAWSRWSSCSSGPRARLAAAGCSDARAARTEPLRVARRCASPCRRRAPRPTLVGVIAIVVIVPRAFSGEPLFQLTVQRRRARVCRACGPVRFRPASSSRARDSRRFGARRRWRPS